MMQSTMMGKSNRLTKMPEIYANHVATYDNPRQQQQQQSAAAAAQIEVIDEDTDDQGYVLVVNLVGELILYHSSIKFDHIEGIWTGSLQCRYM